MGGGLSDRFSYKFYFFGVPLCGPPKPPINFIFLEFRSADLPKKLTMPVLEDTTYRGSSFLKGAHIETIIPSLIRKVKNHDTCRERIDTPDGDFLDLDWSGSAGSEKVVILSHGLEGSSDGHYIKGMAQAFNQEGWRALAWNFRGCSGEPNLKYRTYHSGATDDLQVVISHVLKQRSIKEIVLIGFSLGGNVTLKYVGEKGSKISKRIKKAVAFSVPCDLRGCSIELAKPENRIYMWNFMKDLTAKAISKKELFPEKIDVARYKAMKTFLEFDNAYTAPAHGFKDAEDYWARCSSRQFLPRIRIPTLLVNARNDPFLADTCYPEEEAHQSKYFYLETPERGGHVGFFHAGAAGRYWSELRALDFVLRGV